MIPSDPPLRLQLRAMAVSGMSFSFGEKTRAASDAFRRTFEEAADPAGQTQSVVRPVE